MPEIEKMPFVEKEEEINENTQEERPEEKADEQEEINVEATPEDIPLAPQSTAKSEQQPEKEDTSTAFESVDNSDTKSERNNTVERPSGKDKSQYREESESETRRRNLMYFLLAPVNLIRRIIRKVIEALDKYTGYDKLVVKSPEEKAVEKGISEGKNETQVKENALALGMRDEKLVNEAINLESFLNKTMLPMRDDVAKIEVYPIKYKDYDKYLDVAITDKKGRKYVYTVDERANGLKVPDRYNKFYGQDISAAYTKFCKLQKDMNGEVKDAINLISKEAIGLAKQAAKKSKNFGSKTSAIMFNNVYLNIKSTSVLGEQSITLEPYIVQKKGEGASLAKLSDLENKSYTFKISELGSSKFEAAALEIAKAANQYYEKLFDIDEANHRADTVAVYMNNELQKISKDLSVNSIATREKDGKIEVSLAFVNHGKSQVAVFSNTGEIINGFNDPAKACLESLMGEYLSVYAPKNIEITSDDINKMAAELDKGPQTMSIGTFTVELSKAENNNSLRVYQKSLTGDTPTVVYTEKGPLSSLTTEQELKELNHTILYEMGEQAQTRECQTVELGGLFHVEKEETLDEKLEKVELEKEDAPTIDVQEKDKADFEI